MKKLMFAIAAVAAGTVLADVTSANIVGYQTVPVKRGQYIALGVQFKETGTEGKTIAVKDLLKANSAKGWTSLHARADQIHKWTGSAWMKFYYNSDINKWVKDGESGETTETVSNGDTVFFVRSAAGANSGDTISISGEVNVIEPSQVVAVTRGGYYFITYPWPVQFAIKDFLTASSNPKGWTSLHARADQVHRWTGSAWSKYYNNTDVGGYVKDGAADKVTEEKLDVGEGVFFVRSAAGANSGDTITFTKPEGL